MRSEIVLKLALDHMHFYSYKDYDQEKGLLVILHDSDGGRERISSLSRSSSSNSLRQMKCPLASADWPPVAG